jgi:Ser/Thr protein kinase RdoA (MazF antagonist)
MAANVREWLLWLCEHYDRDLDTPENNEIRRLGRTLEELGRLAGAIDTTGEKFGLGACLLDTFDWEHGEIELFQSHLLTNRLGSADPEALIARLVAVTGIPERPPAAPPEPEYVV